MALLPDFTSGRLAPSKVHRKALGTLQGAPKVYAGLHKAYTSHLARRPKTHRIAHPWCKELTITRVRAIQDNIRFAGVSRAPQAAR